jgi:hypothetical protein
MSSRPRAELLCGGAQIAAHGGTIDGAERAVD